ncbi:hypothetical protein JAAARDRAFT_178341 [Jaapia argillacea MUCL 33604]|uniref:N-terminal nucleophile aminohydrolase n=1 Tax=Jaapia argillacea MUCL 33604 TaxID=933084 RepID=A0A067Q5G4_9AGAM|nr:hypothetical protein JAAARDRAFT_178341 [Jaapia argillacea MUCL 33604]
MIASAATASNVPEDSRLRHEEEPQPFHLVAVHGGAGFFAPSEEREVKRALRLACATSLRHLQSGKCAVDVATEAISVLEDQECLNAGYGSNLTLDGKVECDASIMDGETGDFGSVGAVSGVKNPIGVARSIIEYSKVPDPLGRLPPLTLVGEGAKAFASSSGLPVIPPEELKSPRAIEEWVRWKTRLDESQSHPLSHRDLPGGLHDRQDTVGAAVWDSTGNLAAGVSSGGLLLKPPGRVGEAAIFGAGCWALRSGISSGMACSVSGSGEYIIRTSLAKSVGDSLQDPDIDTHEVLKRTLIGFCKNCERWGEHDPNAGILLLTQEVGEKGAEGQSHVQPVARLWCAFTSPAMAIAFASSQDPNPKAMILRRPSGSNVKGFKGPPMYISALPLSRN